MGEWATDKSNTPCYSLKLGLIWLIVNIAIVRKKSENSVSVHLQCSGSVMPSGF